jgi:hypothetical protein
VIIAGSAGPGSMLPRDAGYTAAGVVVAALPASIAIPAAAGGPSPGRT